MGSLLGYRLPQFSEELAWLPSWFQQQNVEPLDDEDPHQTFMSVSTREDGNMSSGDTDRYKSYHLFLSAENMSSASPFSSSGDVVGFHLHLSPDGTSQNLCSPGPDTFQVGKTGSDNVVQKNELVSSQELKGDQCPMDYDAGIISLQTLTSQHEKSDHDCLQSLANDKGMEMRQQEKADDFDVSNINGAVELSIAAAEALIIHEMVKSLSSTNGLSTAAILEVALRVKQARLEGPEGSSCCSRVYIDEDEFMSDSHEIDLTDAFEDVGLTICRPDDLCTDISQVKETPNPENHFLKVACIDTFSEQGSQDFIDISDKKQQELLDCDGTRKIIADLTITTSTEAPHKDIAQQLSMVENTNIPAETEGLNIVKENMMPSPTRAKEIYFPQHETYPNKDRDDKLYVDAPVKFQSRWLGGWMAKKKMNASMTVAYDNPVVIRNLLGGETSYLSESADVAPDAKSFVQKQDEETNMTSQTSVAFRGLHDGADEGVMFPPDAMISSCLSLTDPLCSVVPCSLSTDMACPLVAHNTNIVEDTEKPIADHRHDKLQKDFNSNAENVHCEQQKVLKLNSEASSSAICRRVTSLRTYSTLTPQCSTFVEKDINYVDQSITSINNTMLRSIENIRYIRGIEENHEAPNEIRQKNPEVRVQVGKDSIQHIFNYEKSNQLYACKEYEHGSGKQENLIQTPILKTDIALPTSKNLKRECLRLVSYAPRVPARKRVRFSEVCTQFMQKKDVYEQALHGERLTDRACKKARFNTKSKVQRNQKFQINIPYKNAKREIFQDIEFLVTGYPTQRERDIDNLIRKHGGKVLLEIPSPNLRKRRSSRLIHHQHPVILCPQKLDTTKFLYGCAVDAFILRVDWLTDSIKAGTALRPDKYMVISNYIGENSIGKPSCRRKHNYIFDGVGIMLYGKHSFCTGFSTVIKHGGGKVFSTLQLLVKNLDKKKISSGVIVAGVESCFSRHLKHCASEGKIHTMTASWLINSLHIGKLLPFMRNTHSSCLLSIKISDVPDSVAFSEEI